MKKQSTYRLHLNYDKTEHTTQGTSPAKALRELVAAAGLELASQDGRYGKTTDGRNVAAMTAKWSSARYADHGTTRV